LRPSRCHPRGLSIEPARGTSSTSPRAPSRARNATTTRRQASLIRVWPSADVATKRSPPTVMRAGATPQPIVSPATPSRRAWLRRASIATARRGESWSQWLSTARPRAASAIVRTRRPPSSRRRARTATRNARPSTPLTRVARAASTATEPTRPATMRYRRARRVTRNPRGPNPRATTGA